MIYSAPSLLHDLQSLSQTRLVAQEVFQFLGIILIMIKSFSYWKDTNPM